MRQLTPKEIVAELDKHIVGQRDAKRAVAIAMRNRWRRRQLPVEMRDEISPKNILMIGPTGVGKTEIARRLAKMTNAPFVKVEATKYTEVGYYGRDVESMVRELVESAIGLVRSQEREKVQEEAERRVEERLLDMLVPLSADMPQPRHAKSRPTVKAIRISRTPKDGTPEEFIRFMDSNVPPELKDSLEKFLSASGEGEGKSLSEIMNSEEGKKFVSDVNQFAGELMKSGKLPGSEPSDEDDEEEVEDSDEDEIDDEDEALREEGARAGEEAKKIAENQREELRVKLRNGELDDRKIEIPVRKKAGSPFMMMNLSGSDSMDNELSSMFDKIMPQKTVRSEMTVKDARKILLESESDALINEEKINSTAIELAENTGIIFLDEIDKIVATEQSHGADVSRQGVQRDLLPIVEGTTIQTRYGYVKTDHVLFIAAGAFHKNKPSDLMPELQGRFPIRVELQDLTQDDFKRILHEPENSLLSQYEALLGTEGVKIVFEDEAIDEIATYAWKVNQTSQNIGARRLYTILERLLEELSFDASEIGMGTVPINAAYVRQRLDDVAQDEDLSRYIL